MNKTTAFKILQAPYFSTIKFCVCLQSHKNVKFQAREIKRIAYHCVYATGQRIHTNDSLKIFRKIKFKCQYFSIYDATAASLT